MFLRTSAHAERRKAASEDKSAALGDAALSTSTTCDPGGEGTGCVPTTCDPGGEGTLSTTSTRDSDSGDDDDDDDDDAAAETEDDDDDNRGGGVIMLNSRLFWFSDRVVDTLVYIFFWGEA